MSTEASPPTDFHMQRSSRDVEAFKGRLEDWLATRLPSGASPRVTLHAGIEANGLSSETVMLGVAWTQDGAERTGEYVARVAPAEQDIPVFSSYDLQAQYDVIRLVGELTDVPVPAVSWMEPTGEVIGSPFFLMERVDGIVPPDVLPYTFGDNWLFDAPEADRRRLQDTTVEVLARLHAIPDPTTTFGFLEREHGGATPLARNLAWLRGWYEWAAADLARSPLVDRALAWLEAHLPATDDAVLCWGDARIGNVLYQDFEPAAVLDWEMVALGPREMDVSWLVFAHRVFQTITDMLGLPGMPDFLDEESVRASYERAGGAPLGDLTWFHLYNGVIWCVVFMRTGVRQIHFGEIERPEDIEGLFHCKPLIEQLLQEVGA
ncbi:MAG: phosphotransferase family protein [Nocardioidaceae bacterium]|nr:phosphotransferase family protein [Nocardioidaceae bacterium]MCL2612998.1 phosphotransferase family protein [Nocardioidaceae bacterium]